MRKNERKGFFPLGAERKGTRVKKVKDIVSRKALPAVLVVTMIMGNVLPVWADDTGNNNDVTGGGYTYEAPTGPMAVDPNVVTATAHRAASPLIDMMGLNATAGTGMINGSAPSNLAEAMTKAALGVWGTALNDSPDPYYWNYFYNFYAAENGLEQSDDALRNSAQQASPAGADQNLLPEYGNISVSLSRRPDIAVGCSSANSGSDTDGYNEQINTIRSFAPDSEFYQEGDESYDPKLVAYQLSNLTTMVTTVKQLADAAYAVKEADPSKTWRYDDPRVIAGDYEKYIYGTSAYVLSEIAAGKCEKKTVALINAINDDGTYTLSDSSSMSATSRTRIVEYTDLVADNLADGLETPGNNGKIATREEVAQADVIICLDNNNTQLSEQGIVESLGEYYNGQMIVTTTPTTLYGITMNSVENAMGLGYIVGYMYSDVLPIDPVEMCAYFYQRFYHISNMDHLRTVVQTNFANTVLPEGISAGLKDDYSAGKVEGLLVQGMHYYENNKETFADTYIAEAGWNVDWEDGIGKGDYPQVVPQTISGVGDSYSKTYGDGKFTLAATAEGKISYELTSGSAVSVDASGVVTILAAGTAQITVRAAGTGYYAPAEKVITIQVAKKGQTISGVSNSYSKKATASAFNLGAKATGGVVSYSSDKTAVATVNASGKVTVKGAGTAKITITAPENANYGKATKTVTITVTKASQTIKLGKAKASYKSSVLKSKKQTFKIGAKAQGKLSYKVTSGKKYISVDKNGKVTVKKGTPKGTYKITVSAAATTKYKKAGPKTVTVTVKK